MVAEAIAAIAPQWWLFILLVIFLYLILGTFLTPSEIILVTVPVLLLSRVDCPSHDPGHGRWLADHLPSATLEEHPDPNGVWFLGDVDWVLARFAAFIDASG